MKHYYLVLSFCVIGTCYGQTTNRQVAVKKLEPAKSTVTTPSTSSDSLAGMTVEQCQSVIDAIDHKVEYIKSDQTQHEKALASGWYDRMAKNRAAWVADRDELMRREKLIK